MKNIIIILISLLSVSVNAQNVPDQYKGQEVFPHKYFEYCAANLPNNRGSEVKPFQPVEMVSKEETSTYNSVKNTKPNFYVQGVVKIPVGTYIIYTYKNKSGDYIVMSMEYKYW